MKKAIFIMLLAGLIIIQFFRPQKNVAEETSAAAITKHYEVPETVQSILKDACYDCHSDHTNYPAYFKVQPIAWFMSRHIEKGKKHLNFDRFYDYPLKRQDHKLEEIIEMVQKDKMPLKSYRLMHEEAQLTEGQKQKIIDWARGLRAGFVISEHS